MHRTLLVAFALTIAVILCGVTGCNEAKDTAEATGEGAAGAAGTAQKMSGGTVGDTDMETGESGSEDEGEGGE